MDLTPSVETTCTRCDAVIRIHSATRTPNGNFAAILTAPWLIDLREHFCPDCEIALDPEWFLSMDAPEHDDDSNYVIVNHYAGI